MEYRRVGIMMRRRVRIGVYPLPTDRPLPRVGIETNVGILQDRRAVDRRRSWGGRNDELVCRGCPAPKGEAYDANQDHLGGHRRSTFLLRFLSRRFGQAWRTHRMISGMVARLPYISMPTRYTRAASHTKPQLAI